MEKTKNRPEQLHLDLQWDYLSRMDQSSENLAEFEAASRLFLKPQPKDPLPRSPLWDEIVNSRY